MVGCNCNTEASIELSTGSRSANYSDAKVTGASIVHDLNQGVSVLSFSKAGIKIWIIRLLLS